MMYGGLIGGVKCCLPGCESDAGSLKFDSLLGGMKLNVALKTLMVIGNMLRISGCVINTMQV